MADEEEVDTGETTNLDQAFLDEDPKVLSDQELKEIADAFNISFEEMKAMAKNMSRTRRKFANQQDNYSV